VTVDVHLFATLARFLPPGNDGSTTLEVPDEATVDDVARALGIPEGMSRVALINGREAAPDDALSPGDVLTLFPPLAGGRPPRPGQR
jgi:molybdopterin synthase sulfur carrier subunit